MKFLQSQMVCSDDKWNSKADHDNTMFIGVKDTVMLNRDEGCIMLYYIISLALTKPR